MRWMIRAKWLFGPPLWRIKGEPTRQLLRCLPGTLAVQNRRWFSNKGRQRVIKCSKCPEVLVYASAGARSTNYHRRWKVVDRLYLLAVCGWGLGRWFRIRQVRVGFFSIRQGIARRGNSQVIGGIRSSSLRNRRRWSGRLNWSWGGGWSRSVTGISPTAIRRARRAGPIFPVEYRRRNSVGRFLTIAVRD